MAEPILRDVERHFDGIANAYYDLVDRVWYDLGYYHKKELAFLRGELRNKPELALDAGCGPGRHTVLLASTARRVVAVDISRIMLELTRKKVASVFPHVVDFVQADVRHMPFRQGMVDLIVNYEVLEHLPDGSLGILATFHEFRRILTDDGRLITEVPLKPHQKIVSRLAPGSKKELRADEWRSYYEKTPLPVEEAYRENVIDHLLKIAGFPLKTKRYVRVLPSGFVERAPNLAKVDSILERIPIVRRFAREVIWLTALQ